MQKLINPILLLLVLVIQLPAIAQKMDESIIVAHLDTIVNLRNKMEKTTIDQDREVLNNALVAQWDRIVGDPGLFDRKLDSIPKTGVIMSDDKKVRMITWNLPSNDHSQQYYCYVLRKDDDGKYFNYKLQDKSELIYGAERKQLTHDNWFGALYYKIIPTKKGKSTIYTLLGWDGNNEQSTKKIIDVMSFQRNRGPKFGANIFKFGKGGNKRIILEYMDQVSVVLRYDEKKKLIVFDHLEPQHPGLKGFREYYVPSMDYDGLKFKKGKWILTENVDIRNEKDRMPFTPPK